MYSSSSLYALLAEESWAESVKIKAMMNEMTVRSVTIVQSAASRLRLLLAVSPQKESEEEDAMVKSARRVEQWKRDSLRSEGSDVSPRIVANLWAIVKARGPDIVASQIAGRRVWPTTARYER